MRAVDRLLAAYLALVSVVAVARGGLTDPKIWWLLLAHTLFGILLYLFTRLRQQQRTGQAIRVLYPLILLPGLYAEIGILSLQLDVAGTFARDATIQRLEAAVFGSQISYEWIRRAPSVFWSGVLHLAYLSYYPIVYLGPPLLLVRGERDRARRVVFAILTAYVVCFVVFVLYPVAGPNYAFAHPEGPVRDVWSARFVYWLLSGGSSFGAAFPSSHVAATVAAVLILWREWRALAAVLAAPAVLMVIGTVYCQMHYGLDALVGLVLGVGAFTAGMKLAA